MNAQKSEALARVLKALANPVRLMIVDELRRGPRCMCELQPRFRLDKSTLSRHLAELKSVGLLSEQRVGVRRYLRLKTPCILGVFDCTMNVLRAGTRRRSQPTQPHRAT